MSYNEIIEYYIPKNIRRLLQTEDQSSQWLGYYLSNCRPVVLYWADIAEWYCEEIGLNPMPYVYTFEGEYDGGGLLERLLAPLDMSYRAVEHLSDFCGLFIRLIERKMLPYNEEIMSFLKQKVVELTT